MSKELAIVYTKPGKRAQLNEKRAELENRLRAIERAIAILDRHPDLEELTDCFAEAMRSEY